MKKKDGGTTVGRCIINRNTRVSHEKTASWAAVIIIASKAMVVGGEAFPGTIDTGINQTTRNEGWPGTKEDKERHSAMISESHTGMAR